MATVEERLQRIETLLVQIVEQQTVREWYSVQEFARLVGRSEYTCREWCRLHRVHSRKKTSGRGKYAGYAISHDELMRFQREGLLQKKFPEKLHTPSRDDCEACRIRDSSARFV